MPKKASRRPRKDLHKIDAGVDSLALVTHESSSEVVARQRLEKVAEVHREPSMVEFLGALTRPSHVR